MRLWLVSLDIEGKHLGNECLIELSIMDKPKAGTKGSNYSHGLYDQDMLDDEAL